MYKKLKFIAVGMLAIAAYTVPTLITRAGGPDTVLPLAVAAPQPAPVVIHMRITAYSSTPDQTDSTPFITANGTHVHDGMVATNILPFGTKITIPSLFGDKVFTVEDRMNAKYQKSVDIWMDETSKAIRFGVEYADVVVAPTQAGTSLSLK